MASNPPPALPTFEQTRAFASMVQVHSPEDWAKYCEGLTREDLFQKVLSVINGRVVNSSLED